MAQAFISLGSNLEHPLWQVRQALKALAQGAEVRLLRASRLYCTPPLGPPGQPDYINAVASVETMLAPLALLDWLQALEIRQGRHRDGTRWGPRTLDLDLLLYGTKCLHHTRLDLPHPQMFHRAFVLLPLQDLTGADFVLPNAESVGALLNACDTAGIQPLSDAL